MHCPKASNRRTDPRDPSAVFLLMYPTGNVPNPSDDTALHCSFSTFDVESLRV
jgi:hypothetical protein